MLRLMSVSLLLFAASWTGVAQSRVISAGIASWDGGLVVQYESRLATPAQARYLEGWTTGGTFTHDGVTRYFVDGKRGIYFGYELVIEYSDEAQLMLLKGIRKYQVKF